MRIGVVSDTHDHLGNVSEIVAVLNRARVAKVVHTGDITKAKTLDVLSRLDAPLVGVYGNNDRERASLEEAAARHGFGLVDPPLELAWAGRRILVVHDPLEIHPEAHRRYDVLLHGHDHRRTLERRGAALVFNPGECAGILKGHNAQGTQRRRGAGSREAHGGNPSLLTPPRDAATLRRFMDCRPDGWGENPSLHSRPSLWKEPG